MTDDRERQAREAVRKVLRNLPWLFSEEGNRRFFRAHLEAADIEFLIMAAREGDTDALDILRKYAAGARRTGMKVPDDLHAFMRDFFIDGPPSGPEVIAKKKAGTVSKSNDLRYQTIALLVNMVSRDYGFNEYCRPEHRDWKGRPMTACQIVAEELGLSERTVEDIWADRKAAVIRSA
jgi:hypothetical protein